MSPEGTIVPGELTLLQNLAEMSNVAIWVIFPSSPSWNGSSGSSSSALFSKKRLKYFKSFIISTLLWSLVTDIRPIYLKLLNFEDWNRGQKISKGPPGRDIAKIVQ